MSHKESFGLRLRAERERQGISLQSIALHTKVGVSVWQAMERNDFSKWPTGLFARSYVRDYCTIVGLNPDEIVDEFCRYFPNGDRRRESVVRAQAEVIDIRSQYQEDRLPPEGDRRAPSLEARAAAQSRPWAFPGGRRARRVAGVAGDLVAVCLPSICASQLVDVGFLPAFGLFSLVYYPLGAILTGSSLGVALSELLARRVPQLVPRVERRMHA
ncbi:MAG: helix-turn-helix domain-containing protein [Bacteroidales bacterium]